MKRPFALHRPAALIVLLGAATGCGGPHRTSPRADTAPPVNVRVTRAVMMDVRETVEAGGVVRARTSATLVSRIMAPVREVRVAPGDHVRAGQSLVVLDDRDLAANASRSRAASTAAQESLRAAGAERDAANAAAVLAQATHQRLARLHEGESVTAQELDQAMATLRGADARVAAADARLREATAALAAARAAGDAAAITASFAVIAAPFDGLVTERLVERGNMAVPGAPLLRVDQVGGYRLDVRVDESRAGHLRPGDAVDVLLEPAPAPVSGTVSEVARAVDADLRAFLVRIDLPPGTLVRAGTFGRALLPGLPRRALVVPTSAVMRRGQVRSVFAVEEGRAHLRLVSTGATTGDRTEIVAGLDEGEWVAIGPPPSLVDGVRVAARPDAAPTLRPTPGEAR